MPKRRKQAGDSGTERSQSALGYASAAGALAGIPAALIAGRSVVAPLAISGIAVVPIIVLMRTQTAQTRMRQQNVRAFTYVLAAVLSLTSLVFALSPAGERVSQIAGLTHGSNSEILGVMSLESPSQEMSNPQSSPRVGSWRVRVSILNPTVLPEMITYLQLKLAEPAKCPMDSDPPNTVWHRFKVVNTVHLKTFTDDGVDFTGRVLEPIAADVNPGSRMDPTNGALAIVAKGRLRSISGKCDGGSLLELGFGTSVLLNPQLVTVVEVEIPDQMNEDRTGKDALVFEFPNVSDFDVVAMARIVGSNGTRNVRSKEN